MHLTLLRISCVSLCILSDLFLLLVRGFAECNISVFAPVLSHGLRAESW